MYATGIKHEHGEERQSDVRAAMRTQQERSQAKRLAGLARADQRSQLRCAGTLVATWGLGRPASVSSRGWSRRSTAPELMTADGIPRVTGDRYVKTGRQSSSARTALTSSPAASETYSKIPRQSRGL